MYRKRFISRNLSNCEICGNLHRELCTRGFFYISKCDLDIRRHRRILTVVKAIVCIVEECLSKSWKADVHWMWTISYSNYIHEMHASMLCIKVTMYIVWMPMLNDDWSQKKIFIRWIILRPLQRNYCFSARHVYLKCMLNLIYKTHAANYVSAALLFIEFLSIID